MEKEGFVIADKGDHYKVILNHVVVLGKVNPLENFKQYLNAIYAEFDKELTKTLYQIVNNIPEWEFVKEE